MSEKTRQVVDLTKKFYDAQDMMKRLLGERYSDKVSETRQVIEALMDSRALTVVEATKYAIEVIAKRVDSYNGMMVAMLLATAVEMIEGKPSTARSRDTRGSIIR